MRLHGGQCLTSSGGVVANAHLSAAFSIASMVRSPRFDGHVRALAQTAAERTKR